MGFEKKFVLIGLFAFTLISSINCSDSNNFDEDNPNIGVVDLNDRSMILSGKDSTPGITGRLRQRISMRRACRVFLCTANN